MKKNVYEDYKKCRVCGELIFEPWRRVYCSAACADIGTSAIRYKWQQQQRYRDYQHAYQKRYRETHIEQVREYMRNYYREYNKKKGVILDARV